MAGPLENSMNFNKCDFKRSTSKWDEKTGDLIVNIWCCSREGKYNFEDYYDEKIHHLKLCKQHFKIASKFNES